MVLSVAPRRFKERIARAHAATPEKGGFWNDVDAADANIHRLRDRVFIGNAVLQHANRAGANETIYPNAAAGANWAIRDSQFGVIHERGGIAVTGMVRSSDGNDVATLAPIGLAAFLDHDTNVVGRSGWAAYFDVRHAPHASISNQAMSFGIEIAGKNLDANVIGNPYAPGYGVHGMWFAGGGDATYGGTPTHPANSGISFRKNAHTWNVGILFGADSITGTDGVTGVGDAIKFARGHRIGWYYAGGTLGASIRSDVDAAGKSLSMVFDDDLFMVNGNAGVRIFSVASIANNANFIHIKASVAGSAPEVTAAGSDTDIDLILDPKGTGKLNIGYAGAAATVAGNFSAANRLEVKINGVTAYIPYMTSAW